MIRVNAVRAKVPAAATGVRQVMGEKSVSPKFPGFRSERKQLRNFSPGGIFFRRKFEPTFFRFASVEKNVPEKTTENIMCFSVYR